MRIKNIEAEFDKKFINSIQFGGFPRDELVVFISKVRKESIEFERERIRKFYKGALKSANTGKKEYRFDSLKDYMDKCFKIFS